MPKTHFAEICAVEPDAGAALTAVMAWASTEPWPQAILLTGASGSYRDYANSLRVFLHKKGLSAWAERLAGYAGEPGDSGSFWSDAHISALLDEAGVCLAMEASPARLFVVVDELWEIAPTPGPHPVCTLIARLSGTSSDHPLGDKLARYIGEIASLPMMRHIIERRPDHRTRDLWPGSYEIPISHHWPFQVVARLWPERFAAMITGDLPLPIVHASITAAGPYDLTTLQALLATGHLKDAASPAQIAADYALLTEIAPLIADLFGNVGQIAARTAVQSAISTLAARSDWDALARSWLQQLIWHGSNRLPRHMAAGSDWPSARVLMIDELCAVAPAQRRDVQEWIDEEEDLWRVDRVLAEAGILAAHGQSEAAGKLLANGILSGQVTQTAREEALSTNTPEARIVGATIQAVADPVGWFEQLWTDTYNARERGTFSYESGYQSPADCVLAWGFAGLNQAIDSEVQARFWQVFTRALGGRIVTDHAEAIPMRLRDSIVRATVFQGTKLNIAGVIPFSELAQFISVLITPSPQFAACMSVLLLAGGEQLVPLLTLEHGCTRLIDALGLSIVAAGRPNTGVEISPESIAELKRLHSALRKVDPAVL